MKILIDKLVKFDLHKIDKIRKFAYHTTEQTAKLPVNRYTDRTHTCGELSTKDVGMRIKLMGRVQYARYNNKIIKLIDRTGNIQCIVDKHLLTKSFRKTPIYNESFVQIEGVVKERSEDQKRKSSHESSTASDDIEVAVDLINVLSQAREDLPILNRSNYNTSPDTQLKYRYLHLRNQEMQQALRFRSEVCKLLRIKLWSLEFIEVETPTLSNRTPGGANEFIVPTQSENLFYSLVQSPQQYKQLLMIADSDRYFQICRCYRDETARSDRQPEFTQVDMELSCTSQDLVMKLMEDLIYDLLCNITKQLPDSNDLTSSFDGNRRLKRLTYHDAFQNYGTDKPDTRFDWLIESTTDKGLSLKIPHIIDDNIGRILIKEAISTLYSSFLPEEISYNVDLDLNQSQISIQHDSEEALKVLGRIRILLAQELESRGVKIYNREFEFIWVTDFPLFTDKVGNLEPNHHPFTAPTEETRHLLKSEPLKVIGQHYDLVLNGQEVAGGSIRIHDAGLQRQIFSIMGVDEKIFDYFLEALSSGCPPHGGIAIGLDRLISILLHRASIKDVIAFPKANSGRDLMTGCPQELSAEVRRLYHMK